MCTAIVQMRNFTPLVRAVLMAWHHLIDLEPEVDIKVERNTITVRVLRCLPEWKNNPVVFALKQITSTAQAAAGAWLRLVSEKDLYRMFIPMVLGQNFPDAWWLQLLQQPDLAVLKEQYLQCLNKPARMVEDLGVFDHNEMGFALRGMLTNTEMGFAVRAMFTTTNNACDISAIWVYEVSEWKMAYCLLEMGLDTPVLEALYHAGAFDI